MMEIIVLLIATLALFAAALIYRAKPMPQDTGFTGDKVHVLIGLYGLILNEVKVFTDGSLAIKEAKELAKSYDCKERTEKNVDFFATNDEGDNEVHLWCNVEVIGHVTDS